MWCVARIMQSWADRGATAVEYCILTSFIALVVIAGVKTIAPALMPGFEAVSSALP